MNGVPPSVSITLPWPDKVLSPNETDISARLRGSMPIKNLAEVLGVTTGSIRGRVSRMGLSKQTYWTQAEEDALRNLYKKASGGQCLSLKSFAESIGRDAENVARKAISLGPETDKNRRKVIIRKELKPRFASQDARKLATGEWIKAHFEKHGHPKGMLGKKHTEEVRKAISVRSKAYWDGMSEEQRDDFTLRAAKASAGAPKIARGSWKAAWHEIGGKRNFYRSQWESNYARYLEWLKQNGQIADWQHEPETFWFEAIRRGVRSYKPDFRVWEKNGSSALHEVKGWMDSRSRTTLARMKKYHPSETIILIDEKQYSAIRRKVQGLVPGWS